MSDTRILKIIVIDDNPAIHQDFIKILTTNKPKSHLQAGMEHLENALFGETSEAPVAKLPNFTIDTASQGQEGVEKIKKAYEAGEPYSLAFVDIRMPPGWDGVETIKHIWEVDENIQVVICTAYSDYTWEQTVEELGQTDNLLIIKKPFDNIAVRQLACALTKKWQLLQEAKCYTTSLEVRINERTESLNKSLSLTRATLESSAEGILVVDNKGDIIDHNTKIVEMLSLPDTLAQVNDFKGIMKYVIGMSDESKNFEEKLNQLEKNPKDVLIGILKFKDKEKHVFEYYTQPYSLPNTKGHILGRVWTFRDVTERSSLEDELKYQATHDSLTGLPNRVLMMETLRQSIASADRRQTHFCVMFLDLDRFKLINDSLSHDAGDEILRGVSNRLRSVIRAEDILVRLGGDEFVVILNNIKKESDVIDIASKITASFKDYFLVKEHKLSLSTSVGISLYPQDGKNIDALLRNADTAMYYSKAQGGNQYQFYREELNAKNLERLDNESELRQAITNNEFFLVYQPQIDLTTEKIVSAEALIRWKHPKKGIVLPIDFIPLAEETGLIVPIGEWVLRTACMQNKQWQDKGLPPIRIAINITTKQFKQYNIVEVISNILKETKMDPQYLELELTENMIIDNAGTVKVIHDLKKLGIQIALDDFGTGYSSLNYLREIPIDRIKIDQSYVKNIESNRGDDVIIQAIITMARNLNLDILAEGVETEKQFEFLKSQKCGGFQGFYFSKPISVKECEKMLETADFSPYIDEKK